MTLLILYSLCIVVVGYERTLSFGGSGVKCVDQLLFRYSLGNILIKTLDNGLVSLEIPDKTTRTVKGEPDLPVLREFVALPHLGEWKVVAENIVTSLYDLEGRRVIPSKGQLFINEDPNDFPLEFGDLYSSVSNSSNVLLHPQHHMRDVFGTILEINPVIYDPTKAMVKIIVSCTIKLIPTQEVSKVYESKVVDATFYDLYEFHYINFHHFAGTRFIKGDDLGRMLVFYDNQFQDSATKFATWKKTILKDVLLAPCGGSAESMRSTIKSHFKESDSLTYVVLFGRSCPTFNCPTSRRECDCQYAYMNSLQNDITLDVIVSRIAASSQSDVDAQMAKFQSYTQWEAPNDWLHQTAGLALDLIGDEYRYMHRNLDKMTSFGFTQADYMQDNSATSTQVYNDWNNGLGLYYYIGHGSGTAWNCPMHTGGMPASQIRSKLKNKGMYPFVLECSCQNGGFKKQNPCFAQSMLSAPNAGPISMYSSAPDAQSSSPKDLQSGATDAMTSKKATRVGSIYYAGIMYAYKLKPSQAKYTLEGYNMFGDPSIQVNFLK